MAELAMKQRQRRSLSFLRVLSGLCIFVAPFCLLLGLWGERFYECVVSICGSGVVGRSSSSVRRRPHAAKIAGSSPARPIFWCFFVVRLRKKVY
jgi:hypothetical protein